MRNTAFTLWTGGVKGDQVDWWQAFPGILGGPSLTQFDPLFAPLGPGSFLRL
jgi:hypothetical protein